jgi:hypothetical protein
MFDKARCGEIVGISISTQLSRNVKRRMHSAESERNMREESVRAQKIGTYFSARVTQCTPPLLAK